MAISPMNRVIQHLRRAVLTPDAIAMSDGALLANFIERRDQAAFEALVRRHGPMVLGVCRRVIGNHHDAEDAFQATFLVLARKAAAIVPRGMVGNWLYGAANQTARKARERVSKRRSREQQVLVMPEPQAAQQESWNDLQPLLDRELERLPDKYRAAIVLCDLEGKTYKDAAGHLGWPEGTFSVRLARARKMLAKRLARHGWALPAGSLGVLLSENAASAFMPAALVAATVQAAGAMSAGRAVVGVISTQVTVLTEGVLKAMLWTKLKTLTSVVMVFGVIAFGGGLLKERTAAAQQTKSQAENAKSKPTAPAPEASAAEQPPKQELGRKVAPQVAEYNALFDRALKVVADYFTVEYANRFEGRIETLPGILKRGINKADGRLPGVPSKEIRRRASITLSPSDAGGNVVQVHVYKEIEANANWKPAGRDDNLEKTILRRIKDPDDALKQAEPPPVSQKTPDDVLLHGEWVGQVHDIFYTLIFGPKDSVELLREDGHHLKGSYSVDWTKTPYHLDGKWNDVPGSDTKGRPWRTIMEFAKKDQLRIEASTHSELSTPLTEVFSSEALVLTKRALHPSGSEEAMHQAAGDLEIADSYRHMGRYGAAYFYYELVGRRYPDTRWAGAATRKQAELKKLQIRRADGSVGWPEPSSPLQPPPPPPQVVYQTPVTDAAAVREISRLQEQVKSLERRLAALETKPGSAAATKAKPFTRVGHIIVEGNRRIPTSVILKLIPFHAGQTLDDQVMQTTKKNLAALNATIRLVENSDSAEYQDMVVTVEEK